MPVVNTKSNVIAAVTAKPSRMAGSHLARGALLAAVARVDVATTDSIGSTLRFLQVRSNDRVDQIRLLNTALTGAAADIGLYRTDDGPVVDVDFFASAASLATAAPAGGTDVTYEAGAAGGNVLNAEQRIWQALGLAADPGLTYDVALTLTAASTVAGSVVLKMNLVSAE